MKKVLAVLLVLVSASFAFAGGGKDGKGGLKIGYISPGSDTWYLRAEEGAKWAAQKAGAQFIAVNSNRDYEKEQANIDYLINEGVNCIVTLSWNEAGSVATAEKCARAGIGCVVFDACGVMFNHDTEFTASVDFDWAGMGQIYADWMKANYPGQNYVYIDGLLDSVVCQTVTAALKKATDALGSNKQVDKRIGQYNPEVAANQAQDAVNSGLDFSIIGVINEDCAAAIITRLEDMGVAKKYHVFAENGSDTGIALLKAGKLEFTISSSPGLEAAVAVFAGIDYALNGGKTKQKIDCPIASATTQNVDDPYAVIPWAVNETVWSNIVKQNFPQYAAFLK
ncbi:MAG: sugar ABC transporter substrate-binding protein [Treponema sp.]|jgi:ribose transport system substrate-binding protein|nr:sugar ABC transporter substrate-binding protein [Treponema sp.]